MQEKWQPQPTTASAEQALRTMPKSEVSCCSGVLVGGKLQTDSGTLGGHMWPEAGLFWGGGDGGLQVSTAHPAMVRGSVLAGALMPTATPGSGRQHQHCVGSGSPEEASEANGVKRWENSLGLIAKGLTRSFGNQLTAAAGCRPTGA